MFIVKEVYGIVFCVSLVVSSSATDCLERLVSQMTNLYVDRAVAALLILFIQTLALYKSFTYLLTYLLCGKEVQMHCQFVAMHCQLHCLYFEIRKQKLSITDCTIARMV